MFRDRVIQSAETLDEEDEESEIKGTEEVAAGNYYSCE
jgi:hypothetical protein